MVDLRLEYIISLGYVMAHSTDIQDRYVKFNRNIICTYITHNKETDEFMLSGGSITIFMEFDDTNNEKGKK